MIGSLFGGRSHPSLDGNVKVDPPPGPPAIQLLEGDRFFFGLAAA
jgi:hypothetical protein